MSAERLNLANAQERQPLQDHCGIVAAFASEPIKFFPAGIRGLKELQTRGYDGAGVVALNRRMFPVPLDHRAPGKIDEVFPPHFIDTVREMEAPLWVLQVRYGTSGDPNDPSVSTQPLLLQHEQTGDPIVIAHNGQFKNRPEHEGSAVSDTVLFARRLQDSKGNNWEERLAQTLKHESGAYSLAVGTPEGLFLVRDPQGIRPLSYGSYWHEEAGEVYFAASETDALAKMGVSTFTEVMPGQMVIITDNGVQTKTLNAPDPKPCIFENVYLQDSNSKIHVSRPDNASINAAETVGKVREKTGRILAREAPLSLDDVDFIVGIPGTGVAGARGFAKELALPYLQAIEDSHIDNDRTFMHAHIEEIMQKVLNHFEFNEEMLRGKKVGFIDDSVVRGNITTGLIRVLKEVYGVTQVHVRVVSPPIDDVCVLGINTRNKTELIAATTQQRLGPDTELGEVVESIRQTIGADSLAYLSLEGLKEAQTGNREDPHFCTACMMGGHEKTNGHTVHSPSVPLFHQETALPNPTLRR